MFNSSDEAIGLVTRISVRTENQTWSCLVEPTAEHRCIIQLGCEVMSEHSVPSAGRAVSVPGQTVTQTRHPVSSPSLSRLQASPTGGSWTDRPIRKYTQPYEVLTSRGQHCICPGKSGKGHSLSAQAFPLTLLWPFSQAKDQNGTRNSKVCCSKAMCPPGNEYKSEGSFLFLPK